MTRLATAIVLIAVMGLSACSQRGGFGGGPGLETGADAATGAGAATAVDPATPEYFNQTIGDRVLFAVDQSTLDAEARSVLTAQARWLQDNPGFTAIIEGHADEQGTRDYNLALGARRAASVEQFLIAQGVPANRLTTISYGKERPIAVCSSEDCYRQNRRAVTVIAAAGLS